MQAYQVNRLKKILWISVLAPIITSLSLFGSAQVRIMPLGDSITHGADFSSSAANTSIAYRGPLWTKLSSGGYNVDFVGGQVAGSDYQAIDPTFDLDHEGHDGAYATDIATNTAVPGGYLDTPTDIVLLHIGTNDLDNGETIANTVTAVETTLDNIDNSSTNIKVILARIINQTPPADQKTTDFNIALNTMVQNRVGDDIIIVDMENGAGINYTTDMVDNLHPDAIGYTKMADLWYSALSTVLIPILPVHLWKLDEDPATTTYVDFYSGANGTCTDPGCPAPVVGQVNGAQSFDGNDMINVAQTATFDWAADANVTIEFWMKLDPTTIAGENQVVIGRKGPLGAAALDIWYVGVDWLTGTVAYGLGNSAGGIQFSSGGIVVNDNNWNHIAYVITGDTIKTYVNGQIDVDVTRTATGEHIQGTNVNIGYLDWDAGFEYTGQLDELTVYDAELSAGLIQQHYENGLNGIGVGDDVIAPILAEVTAVSTPTSDTTPNYTFSSDEAGTITYVGSCTSTATTATVGDNTITFNALADGTYSDCNITVTDAATNASTPLTVTAFTIDTVIPDTTAPILAEVTAVITPTSDTTPNYTFSSDEAGTITYVGSCTSTTTTATVGDNTITFNALADGTYSDCTITVTDAATNASTPLPVTTFEVDITVTVPDITAPILAEVISVITPTSDTTPNYTFSSDEAGTITYVGSCTSTATTATVGNNTITFNALADGTYSDCTITVTDAATNASTPLTVTAFTVDTEDPIEPPVVPSSSGGGCSYNPNSKNFDMTFLLMMGLGLFYPFRRRFIK